MNATLTAGSVVRAPRYVEGKRTGVRKGVVLGEFSQAGWYMVWFYAAGDAQAETRLVTAGEATVIGDMFDLPVSALDKIAKGARKGHHSASLGLSAARLRDKLRLCA